MTRNGRLERERCVTCNTTGGLSFILHNKYTEVQSSESIKRE